MNSIYEETLRAVENGAGFMVDFRRRNLKIDGRYVIENGRYEGELGVPPSSEDEFFSNVEELYCRYKHSVPSERSEGKSRRYFRAMPEKDLDDDDMLYGERRDKAQVALELYLLCQILHGFKWNPETMGRWFWQSRTDRDLVILREWIEPENNQSTNHLTIST